MECSTQTAVGYIKTYLPHLLKFDSRESDAQLQKKPPLRAAFFMLSQAPIDYHRYR